jgi:hypothetical protein
MASWRMRGWGGRKECEGERGVPREGGRQWRGAAAAEGADRRGPLPGDGRIGSTHGGEMSRGDEEDG